MPFQLPELPFAKDSLAPHMSAETFDYHWGKHHRAYVTKTNELVEKAGFSDRRLSDVIRAAKDSGDKKLFNNAAQIWNHSFYWQCLSPERQQPSGELARKIDQSFGSTEALLEKLKTE